MSLFVVGTSSHAGKSVTVAAICRCLVRRGISVAPFKSQNMSLNSFVAQDGGEIGMAQAMQAYAARLLPATDMNPILLKPKGDGVSQVVLYGRPYKDVPITDYYRETPVLLKKALESFNRLQTVYGNVVIEGRRLALYAEVAAARFRALQRVEAHQLGQFEKVRHAPRLFERLVQFLARPDDIDVVPELLAQRRDLGKILFRPASDRAMPQFSHIDPAEFLVE